MGLGCVDGAWDVWEGVECASLLWWLTRDGRILAVSTDASGTRDMPVRVVHNEGEQRDTDKEGYAWRGMYAESLRVDVGVLWVGGYGRRGQPVAGGGKWEGECGRQAICIM